MAEHRKKATEMLNESDLLLGKTTLQKAYPQIENIFVSVTETFRNGESRIRTYDKTNTGEFSDCSNQFCVGGGVSIGEVISQMVRERKTEGEKSSSCRGHEGSPKGRKIYGSCYHRFNVSVKIGYYTEPEPLVES
jgi:hypothetical protein